MKIDKERTNRVIRQIRRDQSNEKFLRLHYQYKPLDFKGIVRAIPRWAWWLIGYLVGYTHHFLAVKP